MSDLHNLCKEFADVSDVFERDEKEQAADKTVYYFALFCTCSELSEPTTSIHIIQKYNYVLFKVFNVVGM